MKKLNKNVGLYHQIKLMQVKKPSKYSVLSVEDLTEAFEYIFKGELNKRKMKKNNVVEKWSNIFTEKSDNDKVVLSLVEQKDLLADLASSGFDLLIENVRQWAEAKDLIKVENAPKQVMKVNEEFGELCSAILKNKRDEVIDGAGDSFVTLILLCFQLELDPTKCLEHAWNEIKNRTGKTVNGTFIKD
jgi:NTP pyrophosphatase (non-canonical NTP hydrolase)